MSCYKFPLEVLASQNEDQFFTQFGCSHGSSAHSLSIHPSLELRKMQFSSEWKHYRYLLSSPPLEDNFYLDNNCSYLLKNCITIMTQQTTSCLTSPPPPPPDMSSAGVNIASSNRISNKHNHAFTVHIQQMDSLFQSV